MAADHYRLPVQWRRRRASSWVRLVRLPPTLRALLRVGWWLARSVRARRALGCRRRDQAAALWSIPVAGDDTDRLLLALSRSGQGLAGRGPGLLSVGAIHELLFATAFAVVGPSPYLPRLVTAIQAALTVPLVYV